MDTQWISIGLVCFSAFWFVKGMFELAQIADEREKSVKRKLDEIDRKIEELKEKKDVLLRKDL